MGIRDRQNPCARHHRWAPASVSWRGAQPGGRSPSERHTEARRGSVRLDRRPTQGAFYASSGLRPCHAQNVLPTPAKHGRFWAQKTTRMPEQGLQPRKAASSTFLVPPLASATQRARSAGIVKARPSEGNAGIENASAAHVDDTRNARTELPKPAGCRFAAQRERFTPKGRPSTVDFR